MSYELGYYIQVLTEKRKITLRSSHQELKQMQIPAFSNVPRLVM